MRKATRRITQYYDDKLAPSGLRTTQFSILQLIRLAEEISVRSLAEYLDLDRTTAGKNLQPLLRAGHIRIVKSARDARTHAISLTAKGKTALAKASPLWNEAQAGFEHANAANGLAALRSALASLNFYVV
jgi:DNA-binding MarR family transcriptional regulator